MDMQVSSFQVADAKARFSELLRRVEMGEEITIRRHGKVVARMLPPRQELTREQRQKAHDDYIAWRKLHGPRLAPGESVIDLIREGRKY